MKLAKLLLIALIAASSLGCAQKYTTPPIDMGIVTCPAPGKPTLPLLDENIPLDNFENIKALLLRDDIVRQYTKGLEDTIACYEKQTRK